MMNVEQDRAQVHHTVTLHVTLNATGSSTSILIQV